MPNKKKPKQTETDSETKQREKPLHIPLSFGDAMRKLITTPTKKKTDSE